MNHKEFYLILLRRWTGKDFKLRNEMETAVFQELHLECSSRPKFPLLILAFLLRKIYGALPSSPYPARHPPPSLSLAQPPSYSRLTEGRGRLRNGKVDAGGRRVWKRKFGRKKRS